ncbi:MAG: UDP-N-acetylmuramoyl-L-alanyl-D-glutamate--2,6-diaminopimelate ligase [Spirochaetaceae bacterium]|nr:UDP-N-acetylmuramoyl-L-alanyl-D-glutamate--2,6-diaminopimelate ligase [Spirochaetaceae bacterium]
MQKELSVLLDAAKIKSYTKEQGKIIITGLAFDSRQVKQGFLFFALPGVHENGNTYIKSALDNGAAAVIYQGDLPATISAEANCFKVLDSRFVMAPVSDVFYDYPSSKLKVIGITGTEGKSTTVFLVWQLLRLCGKKCGFISTVEYSLGGEAVPNPEHQTTPEAPIINEKLNTMLQNGCEYAVIESSSHGLSPRTNRLGSVLFDAVAFMNVTHEHLEFHGTYEQYKDDKANLFRALDKHNHKKSGEKIMPVSAVNLEDPAADFFANATKYETIGFAIKDVFSVPKKIKRIFHAADIESDTYGERFTIEEVEKKKDGFEVLNRYKAEIKLPGVFNIYNVLAACILVSGITHKNFSDLILLLPELVPVRGRMSTINKGQPFEVLVDYAHTPSSFETIFPPLKKRAKGRIISLFGSGGERDTQKRPVQGKIASEYSDIVILADEDPRGEDPLELLEMIAAGCTNSVRDENLFLIPDRPSAIRKAFSLAKKDDIVLLLGKGHENSIIYKDRVVPYDEIKEAEKALLEMGYADSEAKK